MKFKQLFEKAVDAGIMLVSAATGGTVAAYTVNHDLMNDEDLSLIVGTVGGAGAYIGTKAALTAVKNNTGVVFAKAEEHFKASSKAKEDAVD